MNKELDSNGDTTNKAPNDRQVEMKNKCPLSHGTAFERSEKKRMSSSGKREISDMLKWVTQM
jgi:hypothetical protein